MVMLIYRHKYRKNQRLLIRNDGRRMVADSVGLARLACSLAPTRCSTACFVDLFARSARMKTSEAFNLKAFDIRILLVYTNINI